MPPAATRRFWDQAARRLSWRINVALWLEAAAPALFAVATMGAVALYASRRLEQSPVAALAGTVILGAVAAAAAWYATRRRRHTPTEALVRIEVALALDSGLSAAAEGVAPWPPIAVVPPVVRWRLGAPAAWLTSASLLLFIAAAMPVTRRPAVAAPVQTPPALAETQAWLAELESRELATPEAVEQLAARARELADQPLAQQYSHGGLEAADALRDQVAAAISGLASDLNTAASALSALSESDSAGRGERAAELAARLDTALGGLRDGRLPANAALLRGLTGTAADTLSSLSPDQARAMAARLRDAGRSAQGVVGAAGLEAAIAEPGGDPIPIERVPWGRGEIARGPGEAPLMFNETASDTGPVAPIPLAGADLSRAALGDLVTLTRGAPQIDPSAAVAPESAGGIAAPAAGCEAVWIDRLAPAERAVLREFFK